MGDTEDFLDCYEVNDNGVTHKSTQLNEGNNWFFGLLPKTERDGGDGMGGGNGGVVLSFAINIFITTLLVIVIMYTLRWFNTKTPVESVLVMVEVAQIYQGYQRAVCVKDRDGIL